MKSHAFIHELTITHIFIKGRFEWLWWAVLICHLFSLYGNVVGLFISLVIVICHFKGHLGVLLIGLPSSVQNEDDNQTAKQKQDDKYHRKSARSSCGFVSVLQLKCRAVIIVSQGLSVWLSYWNLNISGEIEILRHFGSRNIDSDILCGASINLDAFVAKLLHELVRG